MSEEKKEPPVPTRTKEDLDEAIEKLRQDFLKTSVDIEENLRQRRILDKLLTDALEQETPDTKAVIGCFEAIKVVTETLRGLRYFQADLLAYNQLLQAAQSIEARGLRACRTETIALLANPPTRARKSESETKDGDDVPDYHVMPAAPE